MRRRATRKQGGSGCGCGGMEILGFPKSGGFMGLFGGQEVMKEEAPQEVMMKQEAPPQEIISNPGTTGVSYPKQDIPMKSMRSQSSRSLNPLARELTQMKREIENLKNEVAGLKSSSGSPGSPGSPGLFGGARRRKTHKKRKSLRRRKSRR